MQRQCRIAACRRGLGRPARLRRHRKRGRRRDARARRKRYPSPRAQPLVVIVKNITGSVRVTEHDRDRVEMHATETVRGDLQADIERARAELQLRTESEPGRVAFRVRRIGDDGDATATAADVGWDDDYSVEYDIEVRVPRGATLDVATVNDGDVTAEGVSGDFTLANVNGAVRLDRRHAAAARSTPSTATSKRRSRALRRKRRRFAPSTASST